MPIDTSIFWDIISPPTDSQWRGKRLNGVPHGITRLYEQGAAVSGIGDYVRRWRR